MSLKTLKSQFLRDLQASWRKTALLGVLLIVGLVVWIPLLVRAVAGGGAETSAATEPSPAAEAAVSEASPGSTEFDWQTAERLLAHDPLLRPVATAVFPRDPFAMDYDQLPLPVLLADEENSPETPAKTMVLKPALPPPDLTLVSTIVGQNRRAAYINGRLCFEGASVRFGADDVQIVSIAPRRVVVRRGEEEFVLRIRNRAGLPDAETPDSSDRP